MKSLHRFIGKGKTLILLFAMIALLAPARMMGQENTLTVYDEDLVNNEYVPIYGVCTDRHLKAEFVMPSSKLADMAYNEILSMKFYSSSSQATWEGIVFHVFLMEVEEPTINSFYGMDNATVVYEGPLSISGNEMVVDFTKPYYYQGGHLLIGFYNTTNGASYWACQWKGETVEGASVQGVGYTDMNSITPTQRNFLPKTTFTYEPENPDCLRPYALTVNNVEARSAVLSWTPGSAEQDEWEFYYTNTMPTVAPDDNTTPNLVNITTNPYTWTGLASEATYYIYVRSNCGAGGVSKWSRMASFTTPPTCIAPTGLTASNVGSTTASLSWTPGVEGQDLWEVYLTIDANDIPDASTTPTHSNLESTSLDLTNLIPEYTYYAYVRANCGIEDGVSAWSPVCSFRPTETTLLTVHDGTNTNTSIPVRGGGVTKYVKSEFVIPATELASMSGKYVTSMTFYGDRSDAGWANKVNFDVFVKEVDFVEYTSTSFSGQEDATVVYQGKMSFNSSNEMTVTFTTPYFYQGGNLLVGFYSTNVTTSSNQQVVYWKGETTTTYTAISGSGSSSSFSSSRIQFLPKTTFTYANMLPPIGLGMTTVGMHTVIMKWSPDPAYTGQITGWEVVYSTEAGFNPYNATPLLVDNPEDTSIGLPGLMSNTQYYAYVRAKNGDAHSPWSKRFTFCTAEFAPVLINDDNPYYYDGFDGESFEWSTANGANHWMRGYGTRKSPSYSMYVSCNQSCIINLGYMTDSYVYKTFDLEGGKEYEISFNWKFKPLHTTQDYFKVYLVPAGTVFEANVVTPVASDWIALDGGSTLVGESKYTWYDCYNTFEIPEGQGGSYMVVFRWHNDNYGSSSNSFWDNVVAIDNLLFNVYMGEAPRPMPQEPEPTEVTLEMETPEVEPEYWQIIYSTDPDLDPYTLDLSEFPDNLPEGVVGVETTDAQPKLEGLDPETGYYVYVRAVYPDIKKDGEPNWLYTRWSEQVSFTTGISCYAVNSIQPTAIAADNATLTWTTDPQQGNANMPQTWNVKYKKEIQAGVETTYDFENGQNPAVYMEGWTVSEGSLTSVGYLENTAAIFPVQLPCSIEFDAKALVEASLRVSVCSDPQGQYQDGVMTRTVTEGEYQHFTVNFAGYEGTKYLMFSTIYKAPVSIDNLTLDVPVWTTGTANGNSFTMNGLDSKTDYLFAVQAHCGEGDDSQWETTMFRTQYGNMVVPYEENFDTYYNVNIPDGWSVINNGPFPMIENQFYYSSGNSLAFLSTGEGDQYAILPPVENVSSLLMEFWSATPISEFDLTAFTVGVMSNPADPTTFVPVRTITTTSGWTKNVVNFMEYEGQGQYIAIQLTGEAETPKLVAIDDIRVQTPDKIFDNNEGLGDGKWNTITNWVPEGEPSYEDAVLINAAAIIPSGLWVEAPSISIGTGGSLTIEDGGVLYHLNAGVTATVEKEIDGYSTDPETSDGWYLITAPLATSVSPANVTNMIPLNSDHYDLYMFDMTAVGSEWQNYKQNHPNFTMLEPAVGYLYANANEETTLQFTGELLPVKIEPPTSEEEVITLYQGYGTYANWNLVGNPHVYPVYPINGYFYSPESGNFEWENYASMPYYRMNEDNTDLEAICDYDEAILPGEGVFMEFDDDFPPYVYLSYEPYYGGGGGGPKGGFTLNLTKDCSAAIDRAIVRFGEGPTLGKLMLNPDNTNICIPQGTEEFAIVRSAYEGEVPVNFKAAKNGNYTLNINVNDAEMEYLHLVDNLTGADVDLLESPAYTFDAKTTDYASRFKLVFRAKDASTGSASDETFAYYNGSTWTVSNLGEATLQVIDAMGRILSSETIHGNAEANIQAASGVYMLRLVNGNSVKVQKVVVR